jgi:hypothetical protein
MALKSAYEIALERQEKREELSKITDELLEHVAFLEECWNAIRPHDAAPQETGRRQRLAA